MNKLPSIKPTPEHIIQPHSRFARQDGWQLDDFSLCSSGNIAVSGYDYLTDRSFVCVYSTVDNSDSRDKPTLLYEKEFEGKYSGWRRISFMEPNSTEIVTCRSDEVQVIDYNRGVVLRSRKVNGTTTCLSVSESQIFIGLLADIVNVYDKDLNRIKSIRLKGIKRYDYPDDMTAAADRLYVCTALSNSAIVCSQNSGSILTEYNTGNKAWSVTVNAQIAVVAVLWRDWPKKQVAVYSFTDNNCLVVFDVESGVSRIRISDQGRIVTGNECTGEVKIYDLVTYDFMKIAWAASLQKDDCMKLTDHFCLSKDQSNSILKSDTPAKALLLALEERDVIGVSNVSRLVQAFIAFHMNETFCHAATIYEEKANSYDRFLVGLSAHLTASVAGDLCDHFEISDEKKTSITSNQNPGLTLLLALHKMGVINQSRVGPLETPFAKFRLVQAVAKIREYQSLVEVETDLHQQTVGLTIEGRRNLFVKFLQKKLKSWYDTMTPVPWKKSCRWKSSDLFVGSGLILTNSKTQKSVSDIDEQCKIHYSDILGHVSLKDENRIIIEGEPGSGKTMLSSQLAYDWTEGKVKDVNIFILLPLKFVGKKTLVEAIKDFYLPEGKGLSLADIEDIITSEGRNCCFLLDGLEEYNGKDETSTEELSEVDKVMAKDKYPNCKVIITSRSGFSQDLPTCPMLKLGQFSEIQMHCYIEKVFSDDNEKQMEVKKFIDDTPFVLALCSVPLLFVLVVHNIEGMVSVQNVQQERIAPFVGRVVETLCTSTQLKDDGDTFREHPLERLPEKDRRRLGLGHRQVDYDSADEYDEYLDDYWHDSWDDNSDNESEVSQTSLQSFQKNSQMISLETLAFNGLCRGRQQLLWQKRFMEENVRNFKQYLDSGILVIEEAVNVGKPVDRSAWETPNTDEVAVTTLSEVSATNYKQWNDHAKDSVEATQETQVKVDGNCIRGGGRHIEVGRSTEQNNESNQTEASESQDSIDRTDIQEGGRGVKEGGITDLNNESIQTDETISEDSQSVNYEPRLNPQHISLQVKFLHKVIQEWFAAKQLAVIFSSYGELPLQEKNNLFREHLQQINPADLHYVLRFTCSLCPQSCHFILNYLHSTYQSKDRIIPEHVMNCICLCLAEYDGNRGRYIKEAISEVCKASITIHSEDSRLLQQAKVSMLQFASTCGLPVSGLQLPDAIVKAAGDKLMFNSGVTLKLLDTLQKIAISRWDQTLREEDYSNIVQFVMNCASIKDVCLFFPSQPPPLHPDTLRKAAAKKVKVTWHIGKFVQTLDLSKGEWQVVPEETGVKDVTQVQLTDHSSLKSHELETKFLPSTSMKDVRGGGDEKNVVPEETGVKDVTQVQLTECQPPLQTEATITKTGGMLQIPNTGVVLVVPPNALPEDLVHCKMQMKIICNVMEEDQEASFSSNSSAVVELLPDNLTLQHPVKLMLPHCLVLGDTKDYSAKIFVSHHRQGDSPHWEEQSHLSYHLEDTTCTIFLDSFCWVKYLVNEKIVKARKIVVFAAAEELHPKDDVATIAVGFCHDLPGKGCKFLQKNPSFIITHMKTYLFRKRKRCYPLQFSLDKIFPSGWQNSEETQKEVSYEEVASEPEHAFFYLLQKKENTADSPLCVVMAMQEKGEIPVHLAAYPKGSNMDTLSSSGAHIHLPLGQAFLMTETVITRAGGTCEIHDTGVVLQIPEGALPADKEECKIQMRIIFSRKVQDDVTSFSSNSSVAVELSPSDLSLQCPVKLVLPHCLKFKENVDHSVRIYTKYHGEGNMYRIVIPTESQSQWEEQTNLKYRLEDSACIVWMDKLCCVKYAVNDEIVIGKKIVLYTAARKDIQKKEIADVEVGYFPDIPGAGELLRLNPDLTVVKNMLSFKEEQNHPLHLLLYSIVPPKLLCCFPEEKTQEIPFRMVAWSIEHSYLYVFQKNDERVGNPVCKFKAFQEGGNSSTELIVKAFSQQQQDALPTGTVRTEKRTSDEDPMTATFQFLQWQLSSEWQDVGRALGILDSTLTQIEADSQNKTRKAIYQMLRHWKQDKGSKADLSTLTDALKRAKRTDLAERVQKEFLEDSAI